MRYRTLGRTGWRASLLGLGSGGASQLGQRYKLSSGEIERLVRRVLEAGVNVIDTAPSYGESESLLGQALSGVKREQYFLSTKFQPHTNDGQLHTPHALRESIEQSLHDLRTDSIDLFYLHGIAPDAYTQVKDRFLPELKKAQQSGLIRHIGITERYQSDHAHAMAIDAIEDGHFDVLMVGLNVMSPAAVTTVLPVAAEHNVGVVVMCAVRSVLIKPSAVAAYVRQWEQEGLLQPGTLEPDNALAWLVGDHTPDVASAAYKFAATHPAVGSVLTGTASVDHFEANLRAIIGPPLSTQKVDRILEIFGPVQRNVQPERVRR